MSEAGTLGVFTGTDVPDLDGLRACVHCGICLPQCPTYRVLGEEMDSPRGRIYLMRAAAERRTDLTETFARHIDLCLGCRACETACPSGVPFGRLLEATRGQLERRGRPGRRRAFTSLLLETFTRPARLAVVLAALRMYQRSGLQTLVRRSRVLSVLPRLAAMERLLPSVPGRVRMPEFLRARGPRRGRVGLLTGCVQRVLYPHVNEATARLLTAAGYDVVTPAGQGCCGALHLHSGRLGEFRDMARALIRSFPGDLDHVVTNAAGCGSAIKEYGHWLDDPVAASFASRARDVTEVLVTADLPLQSIEAVATYHDACHLIHGQRVRSEPRVLLSRIPGLRLVELPESDMCCGSAGVYNLMEPEIADRLLERKVAHVAATGARIVVAGNPGCLLQIEKGCRDRGLSVQLLHPVELLARALRP